MLLHGQDKKRQLPKDFENLLEKGDLAALQAVFDICDLDARGGYAKQTALAFDKCPDELSRWLVAKGANLSATDTWGNTPLHARSRSRRGSIEILLELGSDVNSSSASIGTPLHAAADSYNANNARRLLEHGAQVDALNKAGLSPLELALCGCRNIDLENMVQLAEALLGAGAKKTLRMKDFVKEIGRRFEFHRSNFNPQSVGAANEALNRLYVIFDVSSVPRRNLHDGKSPIIVKATTWQQQHQELWKWLVPSSGPAMTIQGEVIRISGRLCHELEGNGGLNWDTDFKKMAEAFLEHVQEGTPLPLPTIAEASSIVADVKRKSGEPSRLAELAVTWVLLNPNPIPLKPPPYKR